MKNSLVLMGQLLNGLFSDLSLTEAQTMVAILLTNRQDNIKVQDLNKSPGFTLVAGLELAFFILAKNFTINPNTTFEHLYVSCL